MRLHSELGYGNSRGLFLHRRGIIQSAVFDVLAPFALGVSCTSVPHQGHGRVCAEPLEGAPAPNPRTGSSCCTDGLENSRLSFQQESGPAVKKICFIAAIINLKQNLNQLSRTFKMALVKYQLLSEHCLHTGQDAFIPFLLNSVNTAIHLAESVMCGGSPRAHTCTSETATRSLGDAHTHPATAHTKFEIHCTAKGLTATSHLTFDLWIFCHPSKSTAFLIHIPRVFESSQY